jgi:hypothetical protein
MVLIGPTSSSVDFSPQGLLEKVFTPFVVQTQICPACVSGWTAACLGGAADTCAASGSETGVATGTDTPCDSGAATACVGDTGAGDVGADEESGCDATSGAGGTF